MRMGRGEVGCITNASKSQFCDNQRREIIAEDSLGNKLPNRRFSELTTSKDVLQCAQLTEKLKAVILVLVLSPMDVAPQLCHRE